MLKFFRIIVSVAHCWKSRPQKCFLLLILFCTFSVVFINKLLASWNYVNFGTLVKRKRRISSTKGPAVFGSLEEEASGRKDDPGGYSGRMAVFWVGENLKDFLFKGFDTNNGESFAAVCVGLTSSAILLEGLRKFRDYSYTKFVEQRKLQNAVKERRRSSTRLRPRPLTSPLQARSTTHDYGAAGDAADASVSLMRSPVGEGEDFELGDRGSLAAKLKSWRPTCEKETYRVLTVLLLSTILHMIYISIGYILMLAVMTFNVWVFVAIAIGIGIGRFFFGTDEIHEISLVEEYPGNGGGDDSGPSPSETAVTSLGGQEQERNSGSDVGAGGDTRGNNSGSFLQHRSAEIIVHPNV